MSSALCRHSGMKTGNNQQKEPHCLIKYQFCVMLEWVAVIWINMVCVPLTISCALFQNEYWQKGIPMSSASKWISCQSWKESVTNMACFLITISCFIETKCRLLIQLWVVTIQRWLLRINVVCFFNYPLYRVLQQSKQFQVSPRTLGWNQKKKIKAWSTITNVVCFFL